MTLHTGSIAKKNSTLVLTLMLSFAVSVGYAQVYKSVDERGSVSFSDQQTPDSVSVEIRQPNASDSMEAQEGYEGLQAKTAQAPQKIKPYYKSLIISTPKDNTIIPNALVPFTVSAKLNPALKQGHLLQLLLDGKVLRESQTSSFTVTSTSRGSHQLEVRVIDKNKQTLKQSPTTTIFAYQPGK